MIKSVMRRQMESIRAELTRMEQECMALKAMLDGYEAWFRVNSESDGTQQLEMSVDSHGRRPKGAISFRKGFAEVLRQARGEPLIDTEIWTRMQALGVQSDAKRPVGFIGLTAKRVAEVEKLDAHTFRWIVKENGR